MFIEIIAKNIDDIKIINDSEANRIEFCHELEVGGLTPDFNSIKKATEISLKPLMIMLRKHPNSFLITKEQLEVLIEIINEIDHLKFEGYVFGAIKDNKVDLNALKMISNHLDKIGSTKFITFHKAFDFIDDKIKAIKDLSKFPRVKTILTAGGKENIEKNIKSLKSLDNKNIKILLGGGITLKNLDFFKKQGFENIHMGTAIRENNSWAYPIDLNKIPK